MQVFFILFSVHFAVYQYINSKCLYRTHVNYVPYVQTTANCHLQNETITQDVVIPGCDEFHIGNHIVDYESAGDVVLLRRGTYK